MPGKGADRFAGLQVPQLDLLVRATTRQNLAIWTKSHREDPVRVIEGMEGLSVRKLPYSNGFIETAASKEVSVGTEGYGAYTAHVSGERADRLTGACVPSSDCVVGGSTSKKLPIGAERDGANLV